MVLKKLDLEHNPQEQGFTPATYDLVLAGSVLHATSDLAKALKNIRQLVKPGGYFVLLEIVNPQIPTSNVGFGVLPGWLGGMEISQPSNH
jgi:SAM-dependent methyltransferase